MDNKVFLDLEASYSMREDMKGNKFSDIASPYNKGNRMVLGGMLKDGEYSEFYSKPDIEEGHTIIGHNIKYDAKWLKEYGLNPDNYKYEDTLLREFIGGCGVLHPGQVGLAKTAERRCGLKKPDLVKKFWDAGVNTDEIPTTILRHYQKSDVYNPYHVYEAQEADPDIQRQKKYIDFAHDVTRVLVDLESNGLHIDKDKLPKMGQEMHDDMVMKKIEAEEALETLCSHAFLDLVEEHENSKSKTDLIDSDYVWKAIYSLEVKEGKEADFTKFAKYWKPYARQAKEKLKYAIENYCQPTTYGIKVKPDPAWMQNAVVQKGEYVGSKGFKAGKSMLEAYLDFGNPNKRQKAFLTKYMEYSKAKNQYNMCYGQIVKHACDDGKVHTNYNQCSSSMRFRSSNPNIQNFPRGDTAKIKDLIVSRYEDGLILDLDYGQIEFRAVGWLAGDEQLIQDVENDFDIHTHTAKMAYGKNFLEATTVMQKGMRQTAKGLTFSFQYGATPKNKTQQAIYDAFYNKYWRVKDWQDRTALEIAQNKEYVCPFTGKVFKFPYANHSNMGSWATKAKNYPVQFLAGAIMQAAMIAVHRELKDIEGADMIIQVHDSLVLDVKLEHVNRVKKIVKDAMENVSDTFYEYFGHRIPVRLDADCDIGLSYYEKCRVVTEEADIYKLSEDDQINVFYCEKEQKVLDKR